MDEAYKKAVALLAVRDYTASQLQARLRRFPKVDAAEAIAALVRQGALDDRRFAENYVRRRPEFSRARLAADLERRGVAEAIVEEVLEQGKERLSLSDVLNATMERSRLRAPLAPRDAQRLFRSLKRLGYGDDEIQEELERFL